MRNAMQIILDVGGEGRLTDRKTLSARPEHPVWGHAVWFTANIEASKRPDILTDAVTLSNVRDASVDGIYSSHTIEHIDFDLDRQMLENWFRVLKPGGRIEIRCPDAEWTWKEYFNGRLPEAIITELLLGIRTGQYEVHRNLWWASKLIYDLDVVGFCHAQRIDYGFTQPYLDFWLYDGKYAEYHGFKVIDLLVEAYKPPIPNTDSLIVPDNDSTESRTRHFQRVAKMVLPPLVKNILRNLRLRRSQAEARALLVDILVGGSHLERRTSLEKQS